MDTYKQIDCFNTHVKFLRFLGIWPKDSGKYYGYFAFLFINNFLHIYFVLYTINFIYLPRKLETFIEDILSYFAVVATVSKVLTFYLSHDVIVDLFDVLESDTFQPDTEEGKNIIDKAKKFNITFWKTFTMVTLTSHGVQVSLPYLTHLFAGVELQLPVFSCAFVPQNIRNGFIYPLYIYETFSIHCIVWYNINIDCVFLGLLRFVIAQLDILSMKLINVTTSDKEGEEKEEEIIQNLNDCIIHYDKVARFCNRVQDAFSVTLFLQFATASLIICVCLFRFTMPAPTAYYVHLITFVGLMMVQRAMPCWFGTRIIYKSSYLAYSVYDCDWTPRSRYFKSSLRLFVERVNRSLSIMSGKMVLLSLDTFSSIMNSAYSFYTLLRHMQSRDN